MGEKEEKLEGRVERLERNEKIIFNRLNLNRKRTSSSVEKLNEKKEDAVYLFLERLFLFFCVLVCASFFCLVVIFIRECFRGWVAQ